MKAGRKTKLTPELHQQLVYQLGVGVGLKAAARAVHLPAPTLFRWLARGKIEPDGPYRGLLEAVTRLKEEVA